MRCPIQRLRPATHFKTPELSAFCSVSCSVFCHSNSGTFELIKKCAWKKSKLLFVLMTEGELNHILVLQFNI